MQFLTNTGLIALFMLILPGYVYGKAKDWMTQSGYVAASLAEGIYLNVARSLVLTIIATSIYLVPYSARLLVQGATSTGAAVMLNSAVDWALLWIDLIVPVVCALAIGAMENRRMMACIRKWGPFQWLAPQRTSYAQAWDTAFAKAAASAPVLVEVVSKRDDRYYGLFGANSAVSTEGGYRDIFLEAVWAYTEGALAPVDGGGSMLIRGAEIATVRFITLPPQSQEGGNQ